MSLKCIQVKQPGTYWYHAHYDGQYPDGLRGPFIVNDPQNPYKRDYDEELVMTFSDWYHDETTGLVSTYLSPSANPSGAEPVPYSALLNDGINTKFNLAPGKTYFVRIISMAAFAQAYVSFPGHGPVDIIEVDGVYTQKQSADSVYLGTAQRYGVLLKAAKDTSKNYAFTVSMDTSRFDNVPSYLQQNVTGLLVYDDKKPLPLEGPPVQSWNTIDDITLQPHDGQRLLDGEVDSQIILNLDFFQRGGQNR